jgi:hypothetical protein
MPKNRLEGALGIALVVLALVVVVYRQAWRESHRGGFPIFSTESWLHMKWWLLIALLVLLAAILVAIVKKNGSE